MKKFILFFALAIITGAVFASNTLSDPIYKNDYKVEKNLVTYPGVAGEECTATSTLNFVMTGGNFTVTCKKKAATCAEAATAASACALAAAQLIFAIVE